MTISKDKLKKITIDNIKEGVPVVIASVWKEDEDVDFDEENVLGVILMKDSEIWGFDHWEVIGADEACNSDAFDRFIWTGEGAEFVLAYAKEHEVKSIW